MYGIADVLGGCSKEERSSLIVADDDGRAGVTRNADRITER